MDSGHLCSEEWEGTQAEKRLIQLGPERTPRSSVQPLSGLGWGLRPYLVYEHACECVCMSHPHPLTSFSYPRPPDYLQLGGPVSRTLVWQLSDPTHGFYGLHQTLPAARGPHLGQALSWWWRQEGPTGCFITRAGALLSARCRWWQIRNGERRVTADISSLWSSCVYLNKARIVSYYEDSASYWAEYKPNEDRNIKVILW